MLRISYQATTLKRCLSVCTQHVLTHIRAARCIARSQIASTTAHGAPRSPWEQPCHYLKLCGLAFQSGSKPSHGPPQFPATEAYGSPRKPHLWPTEAHGNPNSQPRKAQLWPTEASIVAHGSPRKPTEAPIVAHGSPRKPTEAHGKPNSRGFFREFVRQLWRTEAHGNPRKPAEAQPRSYRQWPHNGLTILRARSHGPVFHGLCTGPPGKRLNYITFWLYCLPLLLNYTQNPQV